MSYFFYNCVGFCMIFVLVELRPVDENILKNVDDNEVLGQGRAGIGDLLNPQNVLNPTSNNNQGSSSPSFPNPLENVFNRTQSPNSNPLDEVKLFFLTVQGALMPASVMTGGFTGLLQGLGNMGNMFGNLGQAAQNLNPLNQNKNGKTV